MAYPVTLHRVPPSVAVTKRVDFYSLATAAPAEIFSGVCFFRTCLERVQFMGPCSRYKASLPKLHVSQDAVQSRISIVEWPETLLNEEEKAIIKAPESNEISWRIDAIKSMLSSMDDGEISISAYDTAWVALVEDIHASGAPQFPSSLQWIVDNQLSDGSWGDHQFFTAHDRIINTLACVVALKSWNICPENCQKGVLFLKDNMSKLKEEDDEHMPIGFEVAFPSLLEIARTLDVEIPYDSPALQDIYAKRNLKLNRIPTQVMHKVPTTLLHSLEGMAGLNWEELLKLQSVDGSFLFSPSSTAFALKQTRDKKCLEYLQKAINKFKGGVPGVYPVDLFEHLWAVDRLERLGISRYFKSEIKDCLDYVYRYWTEEGICWARNSKVRDIDDTAMGFRLLRLHGYDVSAEVFQNFENGGEFFCFAGQSNQAITGIFNLNRASQISFPGEKILDNAKSFSYRFLRKKQASGQLLDKWIITKDLPGEVGYALDFPWYASLPRVETRFYLEQYGGEDDVWIGKTLYRMPYVNNNIYMELAKLDFNECQAVHKLEWLAVERWYVESNLRNVGVRKNSVLQAYFLAAANIFEPERASERLSWARTTVLMDAISSYFTDKTNSTQKWRAFLEDFTNERTGSKMRDHGLVGALRVSLHHFSLDALMAHGIDVHCKLRRAWEDWLMTWQSDSDYVHPRRLPTGDMELLVRTINLCGRRPFSDVDEVLSRPQYVRLASSTNALSLRLRTLKAQQMESNEEITLSQLEKNLIESEMQELVQCVLQSSDGIDHGIKQTFLSVSKSFYYSAHSSPSTFNNHISKVLFQSVV